MLYRLFALFTFVLSDRHTGSTWPICTLYQMLTCVIPTLDVIKQNVFNASDVLNCPLPCESLTYVPSITFSYLPSNSAEKTLRSMGLMNNASDVR